MVVNRNREDTVLVGDSGGYQIGSGAWKLDWSNFENGADWQKTRCGIMTWFEEYCDYSMTQIFRYGHIFPYHDRTGLKDPKDCLEKTIYNHKFFIENRMRKTKFLNTLHGANWETSENWYQNVKEFNDPKVYGDRAFEGYAMAGDQAVMRNSC